MQNSPDDKGFMRALIAAGRTSADADLFHYSAMLARHGVIRDLRVVHVLPDSGSPNAADHDGALAELQAASQRAFGILPTGTTVRHDLLRGPVTDRLLEYSAEQGVDLILLGHRQAHSLSRSLARRLAMKAPCSVWLMPEGSAARLSRILVPIDFSHRSADAVAIAAAVATRVGLSEVTALHVYFDESRTTYDDADLMIRGREAEAFRQFLAPINTRGVGVNPIYREGVHPARTIVEEATAQSSDLIVLETRGRSRSAAVLLGSVAEETLIHSHVPVLVVKHFGARMGVLQALLDRTFRHSTQMQFH